MVDLKEQVSAATATIEDLRDDGASLGKKLYSLLCLIALVYAFIAGLRTVVDWDLGWQMATARWIVQHHQIPSVDVLSYTAAGRPWIYPVGSGLIFYALYQLGGYALLSWFGAAICVATIALLLRRGSAITAFLAILAVPLIAQRSTPRADVFSVVLVAAYLSLLWQQHETGRARLWLLPALMVVWVNLHLGLSAGLALITGYAMVECLETPWPDRRSAAIARLRKSWPWLIATVPATFVNPWGWRVFLNLIGFMTPMTSGSEWIMEWAPAKLSWPLVLAGLSLRNPNSFVLLLLVAAVSIPVALWHREIGAAILLAGSAWLGMRHLRLQVFFSIVVVIVAGAVLTQALQAWRSKVEDLRTRNILAVGASCLVGLLVTVWSLDLVTQRTYFGRTDLSNFGTGLGWWFPEGGADFLQRESIPGEVFNSYDEGGFVAWRLGPKYRDYIDGRANPFGMSLVQRSTQLMDSLPDSPEWQTEATRYNINAVLVALGRYQGVEQFPVLNQFCRSRMWTPVYLDETSAVFLRRTPATQPLIDRLQIDCATVPFPLIKAGRSRTGFFNRAANTAVLLKTLGRYPEALAAIDQALVIDPGNAFLHFNRAEVFAITGQWRDAELEYLTAAKSQPNTVSWAKLAKLYERQRRITEATQAWERVIEIDPGAYMASYSLAYDYLNLAQPREALSAFDGALRRKPKASGLEDEVDESFFANVAHGRAMAWKAIGDSQRAIAFEQETLKIAPDRGDDWLELANLYESAGRAQEAVQARQRATQLGAK